MIKKSFLTFCFAILCFFVFCSCSQSCSLAEKNKSGQVSVKVLNWNLETFFDGNFDGNEYDEFKNSSAGWSSSKYDERLERLSTLIKTVDADIVIMEELEKEEQLYDIYNRLCSNFNLSRNYSYGCFTKSEDSSIGIGIISRFPLKNVKTFSLDIRTEGKLQPEMRPIMTAEVTVKEKDLTLAVNHWKSKSGGQEETELWRNYQEKLLAEIVQECYAKGQCVLAAGDFNRDIVEFKRISGKTSIFNVALRGNEEVNVYSPWYKENGELYVPGSYYFNGSWERIDHFFAGRSVTIQDFKVEKNGEWASPEGFPLRYSVKYGKGWSDHFPVSCTVVW